MDAPTPHKSGELSHESPFFRAFAEFVLDHRALVVLVTCLITGYFVWATVKYTRVDNNVELYIPADDPGAEVLDEYRALFGRSGVFMVVVEGDVFTLPFLTRLKVLHTELEAFDRSYESLGKREKPLKTPRLDKLAAEAAAAKESAEVDPDFADADFEDDDFGGETSSAADWAGERGTVMDDVTSLINARRTQSIDGGLVVGKWFDPLPSSEALPALKKRVLEDKTLRGQVVGREGRHAAIVLRTHYLNAEDSEKLYFDLKALAAKHKTDGFVPSVGGGPAIDATVNRIIKEDMATLVLAAVFAIFFVLFFTFRHPIGVFGPIIVVAISVVWTLGIMALVGIPLGMISAILPAFLLCVGMGDSIHIQSVYRDLRAAGAENREAIVRAVAITGVPVMFTSLTTLVGLLSFRLAKVVAIRDMGLSGAFGVGLAFLISVALMPIALSLNKKSLMGAGSKGDSVGKLVRWCYRLSQRDAQRGWRTRNLILGGGAALALVCGYGMSQLRVFHDPLDWMQDGTEVKQTFHTLDAHLGGSSFARMVIYAPEGLKDRETLLQLQRFEEEVLAFKDPKTHEPMAGNVISLLDVVRESHRAFHGGGDEAYKLPDTQGGVEDMLLGFETASPDQLRQLTTVDMTWSHMTFRSRWKEASDYGPYIAHIRAAAKRADRVDIRGTGLFLFYSVVTSLIGDLITSFGFALVVISFLMLLVLRDVKLAILAMVPNLLPIGMVLALMGFTGIPIDLNTLLIASIAIGISVDDTIHLLHHFRVHREATGDVEEALRVSLEDAGRAMITTSAVLIAGFSAYVFGSMANVVYFGLLVAATALFAVVMDLILGPALLRLYRSRPL